MEYPLDSRKKKYFIFTIVALIIVSGIYMVYAYTYGFDTYIVLSNNTNNLLNEGYYKYVDLKVLVNDKVIYDDSLRNGLHDTLKINTKLNFGSNLIEVYSDKAKMYDHKVDNIFFNKAYYISFTESPKKMNYYKLDIYSD